MCFGGGDNNEAPVPAPAPAPPIEAPDVPAIGASRREESRAAFGADAPTYRVNRSAKKKTINPDSPIQM